MLRLSHSAGYYIWDICVLISGSLLFAVSLDMFLLPAKIILGGFTGIATLLNLFFNFHIGAAIFILNIPFMLVNIKYYGIRFLFKSFVGIIITSTLTDILSGFIYTFSDPLTCSVFGGISMGVACGIMFSRGYTTGGTDLVAWMLKYHMPHISIGRLIFISDAAVIGAAAIVNRKFSGLLWSMITVLICSKSLDTTMRIVSKVCNFQISKYKNKYSE